MKTSIVRCLAAILSVGVLLLGMPPLVAHAAAGITLDKVADKTTAPVGENITYTYTITNTGTENITSLLLTDDKLGPIALSPTTLAVGENVTASVTYQVKASDAPGPIKNTATVTGTPAVGDNVTATDTVEVGVLYTSIKLEKTAAPTTAAPHQVVTYTFKITNTGNVDLTEVALSDPKLGGNIGLPKNSLAAGESITVSKDYTVTVDDLPGPLVNTAVAQAKDPAGIVVTSQSQATVTLTMIKSLLTKAEILILSGVPGKGIKNAPGLQKPFNPKSQAANNAGKKGDKQNGPQVQNRVQKQNRNNY